MTTRSGREYSVYKQTAMEEANPVIKASDREEPSLTQLLQALLTTREEEKRWERVRQEEERAQRQEERKVQIDLMKALLEGATPNPASKQPNIYFRKLTEADDIEAYLTTFERLVTSEKLEQHHWAFKLAPYLTGKAQQAYAALSNEEAANYKTGLKKQFYTSIILL